MDLTAGTNHFPTAAVRLKDRIVRLGRCLRKKLMHQFCITAKA